MKIVRFLRTTAFRLALFYTALFCASVLALFAFLYWTMGIVIDRQREQTVVADLGSLSDEFTSSGVSGLAEEILARIKPDRVGDSLYLLTDPASRPLAGNVSGWPHDAVRDGPWLVFAVGRQSGDPEPHLARAVDVELPGGYRLLVGQDMRAQERFQTAIVEALVWSLAITLVLGVGGGLIMSRNALRRIEAINRAAERIMRGEVGHRMPVGAGGDEFDRLAENLNAMLDEIERLMGGIRAVTHNIAHDLRGPLTRVKNRLETALAADSDAVGRREAVEQAVSEADDLLATFNALLSIADAEAGAGRGDMAPVDLAAVAGDVAELYEPLAEARGLALDLTRPTPAMVDGNRHLLFQAIANLLDNAVKYAPPGGRVGVRVETGAGGPRVVVSDDGPGIPEADRGRVLERFVRLDSARSTPGSGLGLSLVAAIARLHGATLALEDNRPGLRATVRFRPASGAAVAPAPREVSGAAGDPMAKLDRIL